MSSHKQRVAEFMRAKVSLYCVIAVLVSEAAWANEWNVFTSECERLLKAGRGTQAKEVAEKCLSLATSDVEKCMSLALCVRASMRAEDWAGAQQRSEELLKEAADICRYSDYRARLGDVAMKIDRMRRKSDPKTDELVLLRDNADEARENLDERFGGGTVVKISQAQLEIWLLLPEAFRLKGTVCLEARDTSRAEPLFREAMNLCERFFGKNVILYGQLCQDLGKTYAVDGRDVLAKPMYEEAAQVFRRHGLTTLATETSLLLAESLEKTGEVERAAAIRTRGKSLEHMGVVQGVGIVCVACLLLIGLLWVAFGKPKKELRPSSATEVTVSVVNEQRRLTYEASVSERA